MPTIDKRFLLKLVLAALVSAGFLFGAHALQARRIPDALKRQADRAADAGKGDAAVHYLRQYLEFMPDDVEAQIRLADMLKLRAPAGGGRAELIFLYDKILRLDPGRDAVRRDALAHCLRLGRYSDAAAHAAALLEKFPDEGALWQQAGTAHVGLNQIPEARRAFEAAIAHAPDDIQGYQRLAQVVWKNLNDADGAKAVLDRMVAALPQDPQAYAVRARFDVFRAEDARGNAAAAAAATDLAIRDLRRVLELDPENADASLALAEILQKGRDVPAAHAILRDATALYPFDLRLVRSLAWLELVRGNVAAATAVLEDGLKHTPAGFDLLVPLADLLVQQGDTTRSAEILKQLKGRRAEPLQVKYLEARLAMRREDWPAAVALLEVMRGETLKLPGLESQVNQLLAACWEKTGDGDAAEKAYRRVTGADPGNVPARVGLATLYLNQGRFDDAAREYDTAVQSPVAPGTVVSQWVRLAARRLRAAAAAPEEWRKLEQAAANAAVRFGPVSSDPIILRADVAVAQAKYAEALKTLRTEAARRPGDTRLWAALAEVAAAAGGTAAGLAVMDEAQAAAGDGPDIRLARAILYAREPGRVRPLDPLADRTDTWAEADQLRLLYGLADVYDQTGDRAKVVAALRRIAARRPADVTVWVRLHERAVEAGDTPAAAEARATLVRIEGEGGPSVLVRDAAAGDDLRLAERLVAAFGAAPNRADACLALARYRETAGDGADAARLTERAFVLEPTRFETTRAWVVLLCRTGHDDRAAKLVARLYADPRWAGEPFRRLMTGVIERLPPAVGATVVGWCRPLCDREPGGLGWLAACYATAGKADDAAAALTAATQAPTATGDDWLRLAAHHAAAGRAAAAAETMAAARAKLSAPAFAAAAAAFRETPAGADWAPAVTDPGEKRAFAQARLAVKLSRSEPAAAAKVLEAFVAEPDLVAADAGWGRRNLAMLYAIGGSADDRKRSVLLLKDAADGGAQPDELRATASVLTTLARYLEGADRKATLAAAAAALTSVYQTSRSPRDLYNLAQLHRVSGNRTDSRRCLQQLLTADPKNVYYLVTALEELTEDRDFATAEAFAGRLRSNYPGEFRAVAAVARYECKAGRADRALAIAEGYAGAADAGAGDYLARSARVAELLDELARTAAVRGTPVGRQMAAAAVERYAALVPTRPEAVVGIAGVLAAEGQVAEAFARIEQAARYLPTRVRALAGLAAVRGGPATDRQFAVARGWIDAALAEEPASVPMRLNEGEWFALRQDYPKATEAYAKVVAAHPRNVVALNNLAWLLAADPATAERALDLTERATREAGVTGDLLNTRARARITLKQFAAADRDLTEALTQEATALRWFHRAVLKMSTTPPQNDEAAKAFREAKARGLDPKIIHPSDLAVYKTLEGAEAK